MKTSFFSKMACRNIHSNRQLYIPYSISSIMIVALFQIMISLTINDFVRERSAILPQLFGMGTVVIGIFSFIFIFYINSFLMKRRKKEIGLYSVLGLEKRHVARILIIENLIVSGFNIVMGVVIGSLFGQMSFLFLNYLIDFPTTLGYSTSWIVTGWTVVLFTGIFSLTMVYNIIQVTFSNPIRLLKGSREGEKEPKSSPILFLIGLISLGVGYFISLTIDNPLSALNQFFIAVILVIIGTYFLFTSGSIIILKALKRNQSFYYKPGPFISISGMLYRMKQHAVGLANISILSVMVIIAVSTTITLYAGTEETLTNRFPEENNISIMTEPDLDGEGLKESIETIEKDLSVLSNEEGYTIEDNYYYRYVDMWGDLEENQLNFREFEIGGNLPMMILLMPVVDYNQIAINPANLKSDEFLIHATGTELSIDTLTVNEQTFTLQQMDEMPSVMKANAQLVDTLLLVTPDIETIDSLMTYYNENIVEYPISYSGDYFWSITDNDKQAPYGTMIEDELWENDYPVGLFYESRENNREEWYSLNGGFLFIGIFLGGLFTIGAVLITYYKQISEGYEDRERIQIMQKVGLDKETTKKATQSQIIWMFTLPILTAVIHTAFAYPIVQKMLVIFSITNNSLFLVTTASVAVVYSLIYWIIYRITSKTYLKIVE